MATRFAVTEGQLATLHTTWFGKVSVRVLEMRPRDGVARLTTRALVEVTARKNRFFPRKLRREVSPFFLSPRR
jgi:hypothetical protein